MILYEKNPDTNTLLDLLESDPINRNQYLKTFIDLIAPCNQNTILAIDGAWGSGKTIYIKQLDLLINYFNDFDKVESKIQPKDSKLITCSNNLTKVDISKLEEVTATKQGIFGSIKESVQSQNINSIYFNAWEHDDETDPLLSIIFQLLSDYSDINASTTISEKTTTLINVLTSAIKLLSLGQIDWTNIKIDKDLLQSLHEKQKIKEVISDIFNQLIEARCNKLILFIDELDRCKPSYALKLLERIKHYITNDRIIVVFSTNILQLSHTVSAQYGSNFDSIEYLDKFFDLKISLPKINKLEYVNYINDGLKDNLLYEQAFRQISIEHFISYFDLPMRQINKYLSYTNYLQNYFSNHNISYREEILLNAIFLPYQIGLYCINQSTYVKFISGNLGTEFKKYLLDNRELLTSANEQMSIRIPESQKGRFAYRDEQTSEVLLNLYNFLFNSKDITSQDVGGGLTIRDVSREKYKATDKILNLLK